MVIAPMLDQQGSNLTVPENVAEEQAQKPRQYEADKDETEPVAEGWADCCGSGLKGGFRRREPACDYANLTYAATCTHT